MPARQKAPEGDVAQLAALLDQAGPRGRGRRSPLARWMRLHHDNFRALLDDKQPNWEEVATALAAMGLRDGDGKPPTADRTRKAWWAVRHAKAVRPAKRAARPVKPAPPPLAPDEIASAVRAAPESSQAETSRPRLHLDIRPAVPLAGTPASTATAVPAPMGPPAVPTTARSAASSPSADQDVDAQLQRLRQQIDASKVPLPKIVG